MKLTKTNTINPGHDYEVENIQPEVMEEQRLLVSAKPQALMQTLRDLDIEYDHWRVESNKFDVIIFYATDGLYRTILRASTKAELAEGSFRPKEVDG